MQLAALSFARPQQAASCPRGTREPGPDDVYDPDMPDRGRDNGGPDSTEDPDFGGRGGGDSYSGPDGTYTYDQYH